MLYKLITSIRNRLYDNGFLKTYRSSLPVICVGNLSVGGNGKTPIVLFLAKELTARGYKPVILSRGYGGRQKGPLMLDESYTVTDAGDEPLMLFNRKICPVVVAANRTDGVRLIESKGLGNIILLDDGYQHRALDRTVNLVCVYAGDQKAVSDFKRGRLLPFGRFREDKRQGLARADAVIFNSRSLEPLSPELVKNLCSDLPEEIKIYSTHLEAEAVYSTGGGQSVDFSGRQVVAFCAIANPAAFRQSIEKLGMQVAEFVTYPDHHQFSATDMRLLVDKASGRMLVCSEKDATKFTVSDFPSVCVLRTELVMEQADLFISFIEDRIRHSYAA